MHLGGTRTKTVSKMVNPCLGPLRSQKILSLWLLSLISVSICVLLLTWYKPAFSVSQFTWQNIIPPATLSSCSPFEKIARSSLSLLVPIPRDYWLCLGQVPAPGQWWDHTLWTLPPGVSVLWPGGHGAGDIQSPAPWHLHSLKWQEGPESHGK